MPAISLAIPLLAKPWSLILSAIFLNTSLKPKPMDSQSVMFSRPIFMLTSCLATLNSPRQRAQLSVTGEPPKDVLSFRSRHTPKVTPSNSEKLFLRFLKHRATLPNQSASSYVQTEWIVHRSEYLLATPSLSETSVDPISWLQSVSPPKILLVSYITHSTKNC